MTLPPDTPGPDPLIDEALAWIVRLKTEEPTRADVEAFERWRAKTPAHAAAFRRAAQIYRRAGIIAGELTAPQPAPGAALTRRLPRRAVIGGGVAAAAAALAGYAVVRPPFGLWPSWQELSADYRTAKGEQRSVEISPGISLNLNTDTSVALPSRRNGPTIELISGEVLVNAQHPPDGDLTVIAADGRIRASQANFDAKCLDNVVSVTCLDGVVDIQHAGESAQIRKGQQVSYSSAGFGTRVNVDPTQVTAWQAGLLVFRDQSLASVIDEVNRYRSGKIVVVTATLRQRKVNGDFQISKLDSFVNQVEQLFGAHATYLPGGLVILS